MASLAARCRATRGACGAVRHEVLAGARGCNRGSVWRWLREMRGCEAIAVAAVVALAVRGLRECVTRMPLSTSFDYLTKGSYGREERILGASSSGSKAASF